jgi:hypothetical protein
VDARRREVADGAAARHPRRRRAAARFHIEFRPRGSAPSGTILTQDFAKNGDAPALPVDNAGHRPAKMLRVNFADTEFDQQTNNVLSPLPADCVDTQRDVVIDLTTWRQRGRGAAARRPLHAAAVERKGHDRELADRAELAIEPGDVKTLDLDGILSQRQGRKADVRRRPDGLHVPSATRPSSLAAQFGDHGPTWTAATRRYDPVPGADAAS